MNRLKISSFVSHTIPLKRLSSIRGGAGCDFTRSTILERTNGGSPTADDWRNIYGGNRYQCTHDDGSSGEIWVHCPGNHCYTVG
jgi:hypothetical protein